MLEQEKILKIKFLSFDQTSHGGCRHFQSLVVVVRALTNRQNPNSSFLSWHPDIMTSWHPDIMTLLLDLIYHDDLVICV